MAEKLTSYKIFVGSPGGLETEREVFRDVIREYNDAEVLHRGVHFAAVGWEYTLRGMGRAQAKINDEIRQCDFSVFLLWDRWGSPPDSDGNYTSGVEEEFHVASESLNSNQPMRQIVVLFKAVDPRQLSDPGPQLQEVLEFKRRLEAEKKLFYDTFDIVESFKIKLRRYLGQWLRDHESGENKKRKRRLRSTQIPELPENDYLKEFDARVNMDTSNLPSVVINEVENLLKQGKLTDAEASYVTSVVSGRNLGSFQGYGRFLIRSERFADAEKLYRQMLKMAVERKKEHWQREALVHLGMIYRIQKNYAHAEIFLLNALRLPSAKSYKHDLAYVTASLGWIYKLAGKWDKAEDCFRQVLYLAERSKKESLVIGTLWELTISSQMQGKLAEARTFALRAQAICKSSGKRPILLKQLEQWLEQHDRE